MVTDNVKRRLTNQKKAILEYLKNTKTHPSAERVYNALKLQNDSISLSTVYRNLSQMSEDGVIRKLTPDGKTDIFDGDLSEHHHFVCNSCEKVYDVFCEIPLPKENVGEITSSNVYFYGICKKCKKDKK